MKMSAREYNNSLPLAKPLCEACIKGKHKKEPVVKLKSPRATRKLELVHMHGYSREDQKEVYGQPLPVLC